MTQTIEQITADLEQLGRDMDAVADRPSQTETDIVDRMLSIARSHEERARIHVSLLLKFERDELESAIAGDSARVTRDALEARATMSVDGKNETQRAAALRLSLEGDPNWVKLRADEKERRREVAVTRSLIAYHKRLLHLEMALIARDTARLVENGADEPSVSLSHLRETGEEILGTMGDVAARDAF